MGFEIWDLGFAMAYGTIVWSFFFPRVVYFMFLGIYLDKFLKFRVRELPKLKKKITKSPVCFKDLSLKNTLMWLGKQAHVKFGKLQENWAFYEDLIFFF